jgi:thiamine transport system substrate-binding protein
VIYAAEPLSEAPTASLTSAGMCFRQVEFVGILKGTQNEVLARKFVDFMLSREFQEDMPLQMFVYPVLPEAALPEEFTLYNQSPTEPASLDPQVIAENRDTWIQAWTELMLQ